MFNKEQKEVHEHSNSSNIIGKGTIVNGDIETFGNIRVEGKIIGNIKTKSKAAFGQSSQIEGNVLAQNAEVEGNITGSLEVADVLILKSTAVVDGDILTDKLIIESGAQFNGGCKTRVKSKEIRIGEKDQSKTFLKAQS